MISLTDNPLLLPAGCFQVSCLFDASAYREDRCGEWGIALPERLSSAVTKRKAEFLAGRYCARLAMEDMGMETGFEVEVGDKRMPVWPAGLVGSITHSKGFASAVVAGSDTVRGVGIDSEQLIAEKTATNVASHILTDAETYETNSTLVNNSRAYLTLIFSAKESIFKCLYPHVEKYFDFRDAEIILEPENPGHFRFRLRKHLSNEFSEDYSHNGLYAITNNFIHTAVILT